MLGMTLDELDALPVGTVIHWQQQGTRAWWTFPKYARKTKKGTWVGIGHPWVRGFDSNKLAWFLCDEAIGKFHIALMSEGMSPFDIKKGKRPLAESDLDESDLL